MPCEIARLRARGKKYLGDPTTVSFVLAEMLTAAAADQENGPAVVDKAVEILTGKNPAYVHMGD